jgi:lipoprotein NlpD
MSRARLIRLGVLFVSLALGACAGRPTAPVREQGGAVRQPESEFREVRAGDTLYSIAWESGRDYRELAAWNNISSPYLIKPGQRLRLHAPPAVAEPKKKPQKNLHTVGRGETLYSIARSTGTEMKNLASWNNIPPPYTIKPGQKLRLAPPGQSAPASAPDKISAKPPEKEKSAAVPARRAAAPSAKFGPWSWPAEGNLLGRFTANGSSKGIDIGGRRGQAVVAAAPGSVVYQGSGLRGYGRLIIIKHNADFLSAYAHCDKIHVKEGNLIKRGQKIAEMGSSGTDRVKLHFEIRYRGSPVDPLNYLPKK